MLMRCAAVGIGLPSVQPRARTSVTARKSASLQVEMVSTYSMWVEPTGDLTSLCLYASSLLHVALTAHK